MKLTYLYKSEINVAPKVTTPGVVIYFRVPASRATGECSLTVPLNGNAFFNKAWDIRNLDLMKEAVASIDLSLLQAYMRAGEGHPTDEDLALIRDHESGEDARSEDPRNPIFS